MPRSLAGLLFVFLGWYLATSCKSACPGTEVDGKCEKTCQDSACAAGNVCVDNACRPKCSSTADCGPKQSCVSRVSDRGLRGSYCVGPNSNTVIGAQVGSPCTSNGDCAESAGVLCIDGTCTFSCEAHDDCISCNSQGQCTSTGACTGTAKDQTGKTVPICEKDSFPRGKGQFGAPCPNGPDSDDCDAANSFICIGSVGDIDAYCTKQFCGGDPDCPSGFFCSENRVSAVPCGTDCDYAGRANTPGCIPSAEIGPGRHYECGPVSLITRVCLHRGFCASCDTDSDCRGVRNQVCARDPSGEKICTVLCDDNINSCPWGAAATCRATDPDLGVPTCSHRFGSCHGTGKSCEPCVDEGDCPTGICSREQFTDERFCVDLDVMCACPSGSSSTCGGGGCPTSPSPAHEQMTCYGGSAFQGSSLENRCVGISAGPGCWPPH